MDVNPVDHWLTADCTTATQVAHHKLVNMPRSALLPLVLVQVLHLVDFEQLKIENQQYFERIDGKNKELLQLKLSTGKTVQVRLLLSAHLPAYLQTPVESANCQLEAAKNVVCLAPLHQGPVAANACEGCGWCRGACGCRGVAIC